MLEVWGQYFISSSVPYKPNLQKSLISGCCRLLAIKCTPFLSMGLDSWNFVLQNMLCNKGTIFFQRICRQSPTFLVGFMQVETPGTASRLICTAWAGEIQHTDVTRRRLLSKREMAYFLVFFLSMSSPSVTTVSISVMPGSIPSTCKTEAGGSWPGWSCWPPVLQVCEQLWKYSFVPGWSLNHSSFQSLFSFTFCGLSVPPASSSCRVQKHENNCPDIEYVLKSVQSYALCPMEAVHHPTIP